LRELFKNYLDNYYKEIIEALEIICIIENYNEPLIPFVEFLTELTKNEPMKANKKFMDFISKLRLTLGPVEYAKIQEIIY